jgi:hypothetical protein
MLRIFIINIYDSINRLLIVQPQICMLIMPIIHIVHQLVTKFWLQMQLMGDESLFVDEYNPIHIHRGG